MLFCFTSSSLYIWQYHMDLITVDFYSVCEQWFYKMIRQNIFLPHTPAYCPFYYFSWPFEICDHFIQLGVEIALNFQINFGKFDIWYCLLRTKKIVSFSVCSGLVYSFIVRFESFLHSSLASFLLNVFLFLSLLVITVNGFFFPFAFLKAYYK